MECTFAVQFLCDRVDVGITTVTARHARLYRRLGFSVISEVDRGELPFIDQAACCLALRPADLPEPMSRRMTVLASEYQATGQIHARNYQALLSRALRDCA